MRPRHSTSAFRRAGAWWACTRGGPLAPVLAAIFGWAALFPADTLAQEPRVLLEVEGGPVWQSSNDVEVPNDGTATRFSLTDLAGTGPTWAGRVYLSWRISERSSLRLLAAPLTFTETGTPSSSLRFEGEDFVAGTPVEATYTFNSYRLSYRWRAKSTEGADYWIGVTAKIRDATVALDQGATSSRKDNVGFVPLLHFAADWRLGSRLRFGADVDALAGGPGRAIDGSLKLGYDVNDRWSVRAGYRTVEGGADVDEVYNFAWVNYAVASVVWRW